MAVLSNSFIRRAKPGRHSAGPGGYGLAIMIRPAKCGVTTYRWQQRVEIDGKRTWRALGRWPEMSVQEARDQAARNWLGLKDGLNLAPVRTKSPSFETLAAAWLEQNAPSWADKTLKGHRDRLALHVYPKIGSRPVDAIKTADMLEIFQSLNGGEIGRKLRPAVRKVFALAVARGHRNDNPAGDTLSDAMPRTKTETKHMGSIPHPELAAALEAVDGLDAWKATKLAVRFQALTAARPGEVRAMQWDEVEGDVWTVPAERAKTRRPHRVPLSKQALEVLAEARQGSGLVFPAKAGGEVSENAQNRLLKRAYAGATAHGLRSSFRDWCADNGESDALAEAALAHVTGNQTVQAYLRTDRLEQRKALMQRWADCIG